jgi:hypothetical protein
VAVAISGGGLGLLPFDVFRCRAAFGRRGSRLGEDRRVVHFEGLAVGRIVYGRVVPVHPDDAR